MLGIRDGPLEIPEGVTFPKKIPAIRETCLKKSIPASGCALKKYSCNGETNSCRYSCTENFFRAF